MSDHHPVLSKFFLLSGAVMLMMLVLTGRSGAQENVPIDQDEAHRIEMSTVEQQTIAAAATTAVAIAGSTTHVVTNPFDSGPGSLRQAVLDAASGDRIVISPVLAGQTVSLGSDLPAIDKQLTIDGRVAPLFTLSGEDSFRSGFQVNAAGDLTLQGLTLSKGRAQIGGAIYMSSGKVTLLGVTMTGNTAPTAGGAIINSNGDLTIINSTLHDNGHSGALTTGSGGALSQIGTNPNSEIWYSTITHNNSTSDISDGLYVRTGQIMITASLFDHNGASCQIENTAVMVSGGYNVDDDGTVGGNPCQFSGPNDQVDTDAQLGVLEDNGGATMTRLFAYGAPGHQIVPIGAAGCGIDYRYDQRGGMRAALELCDSGAVELDGCLAWTGLEGYLSNDNAALQLAVDAAVPGGTVNVAGLCPGSAPADTINKVNASTLSIEKDLTLQGQLAGAYAVRGNNFTPPSSLVETAVLDANGLGRVLLVSNSAEVTIANVTLARGYLPAVDVGAAMAVAIGSDVTIKESIIRHSGTTFGGGLFNDGILTVRDSWVTANGSTGGGGLYNNGTAEITGSTFSGNYAFQTGGAIFNANSGTVTLGNSTVSENQTGNNTAGIESQGVLAVINSTISNNYGVAGVTGINNLVSQTDINSANGTDDPPPAIAGGVANVGGTMNVTNSIVADNTNGDCGSASAAPISGSIRNLDHGSASVTVGHTLIKDGSCNAAAVPSNKIGDPLLGPLGNNGGQTWTSTLR